MYNTDLETYYGRIQEDINVASSYVANEFFPRVIRSCRLKPANVVIPGLGDRKLKRWWIDEFGNSLFLTNNKVSIKLKDKYTLGRGQISTDLFSCRDIIGTMKESVGVAISHNCLTFIGRDEYWRSFRFDGQSVSCLEIGPRNLFRMAQFSCSVYKVFGKGELEIYSLARNSEIVRMIEKEYGDE